MIIDKYKEAKRFELDIATDLSARRVFLSGAGIEKADVRRKAKYAIERGITVRLSILTFRVEAKTTKNDYYTFRAVDWIDLIRVADAAGEMPVFAMRYLQQRANFVLIRQGFAAELGINGWSMPLTRMNKTIMLRPTSRVRLEVPRRVGEVYVRDTLAHLPYTDFIERVSAHADFA